MCEGNINIQQNPGLLAYNHLCWTAFEDSLEVNKIARERERSYSDWIINTEVSCRMKQGVWGE